jgi:proline dehydrogenase
MNLVNALLVSIIEHLPKPLVKRFAMRYIAGDSLEDAVRVVKMLNAKEMMATLDVLGENVTTKEESLMAVRACEKVLCAIHDHRLNGNLSLKLTQCGLKIDEEFCYSNVRSLLETATGYNNFVRFDMEDSSTTSRTLNLYERLRSEGFENVGVVIQAHLRRTENDIQRLVRLKANVRLCKGAYLEPEAIAFRDREEIRFNFLKGLKLLLDAGCYVGIATHDEALVRRCMEHIRQDALEKRSYEFQMLLGVKVTLRERIVADGHRLRVYVPFGEQWYAYSTRRFKENPQIARTVLRNLFSRS